MNLEIISISQYQKAGPLIEKILELSGGKLAREDARRLVDRIWQFQEQTPDQLYVSDLLQLAKDLGLSSNEWNAI